MSKSTPCPRIAVPANSALPFATTRHVSQTPRFSRRLMNLCCRKPWPCAATSRACRRNLVGDSLHRLAVEVSPWFHPPQTKTKQGGASEDVGLWEPGRVRAAAAPQTHSMSVTTPAVEGVERSAHGAAFTRKQCQARKASFV